MTETATGAEYISEAHVRHIMRYVQARDWIGESQSIIVDAACGTGYGSKLLARSGHIVIGLDFDDAALKQAEKDPVENCAFRKSNLINGYLNTTCNAIVCIETIEHVDPEEGCEILQNFNDWLPSGGMLILSSPYCIESGPSPITLQHKWEYNLTDLEITIATCGFEIEIIKPSRHKGRAGRLGYCMVKAHKK